MIRTGILCLILLFVSIISQAQIIIDGIVNDDSGKPVSGVNVILQPLHKNIVLSYSLTGDDGKFLLKSKETNDTLKLVLTSFDYERLVKQIMPVSQTIDIQLKVSPIMLKEVAVMASPIVQYGGDTISYLVSSFSSKDDKVIGDVLKKMPGIDMDNSGRITYQGREINKFYIENMDMLQGRYNIATKNISAEDVASVEIFENHQPVKVLQDIEESDRAAINLKLKPDSKGVLSIMAQIGLGAAPLLWNNELTSLYFSKKWQSINTYKCNNSGNDLTSEFTSFYSDAISNNTGDMLSTLSPSSPPISLRRYLFNNTHAVSSNLLRAISKDVQFSANILYYNDYLTKEGSSISSYYLSQDSILQIKENSEYNQSTNNAEATFKIESNKEKVYFANSLNLSAKWDFNNGNTITPDIVRQHLDAKKFNITNKFDLKKNIGGNILSFVSTNSYNHTPQEMTVKSNLYKDLFANDVHVEELIQNTVFNGFNSDNVLFMGFHAGNFIFGGSAVANMEIQTLESSLNPVGQRIIDSLNNNLVWNKYNVSLRSGCTYKKNGLQVGLSLPIEYDILHIIDKIPNTKENIDRLSFNPYFNLVYDFSSRWTVKANYSHNSYFGSIRSIFTGYILQTYNMLNRYDGQLADNKSDNYYLRFAYRNVTKSFFGNINFFYEQYHSNLLLDRSFIGIIRKQETIIHNTITDTYGFSSELSKYFSKIRTTVKLKPNYLYASSSIIQQGEIIDYDDEIFGLKCGLETCLFSSVEVSCDINWNISRTITATETYPNINTLSNFLKINVFPMEKITVTAGLEHYYTTSVSNKTNMFFADLYLKYKFSKIDLSLAWCNIFNTTEFNTITYNEVNKFIYNYEVRPSQIILTMKFKIL